MFDCRYYDLCCFTDDSCNGEPECPKRGHCQFYSPMPDVDALLALADEIEDARHDGKPYGDYELYRWQRRIREACGEAGR